MKAMSFRRAPAAAFCAALGALILGAGAAAAVAAGTLGSSAKARCQDPRRFSTWSCRARRLRIQRDPLRCSSHWEPTVAASAVPRCMERSS
jgi:hypothetical protein